MKRFLLSLIALAFLAIFSPAEAATRFAVCTVTCTWDNSSTAMWCATDTGCTGASAPTSSDDVTLNANTCVGGVTCTITVNATLSVRTITMGACTASTTGCILDFATNNNSITIAAGFSGTGTGTRTLNMGSGTWTLSGGSGSANEWDCTTVTNFTLNANTSTILYNAASILASRKFIGGGKTYSTVTVVAAASFSPNAALTFSGSNTIATFNITGPTLITINNTQTITNAFNWTGPIQLSGVGTVSSANNGTISSGAVQNMTFSGGGTFICSSCYDFKNNTGININPPAGGGGIIGG